MIEGGWSFVYAAYLVSIGALAVLCAVVLSRLMHWSKQAQALDKRGKDA